MPTIEERLEAVTHTLELVAQMQQKGEERIGRIESVVNVLAESQTKTERVMSRLAVFTIDHEQRLQFPRRQTGVAVP